MEINCEKEFVFDFIQKLRNIPEEILPSFLNLPRLWHLNISIKKDFLPLLK